MSSKDEKEDERDSTRGLSANEASTPQSSGGGGGGVGGNGVGVGGGGSGGVSHQQPQGTFNPINTTTSRDEIQRRDSEVRVEAVNMKVKAMFR